MSGLKAYRLMFRRDLTASEQIERNLSIAVFNLKIFVGTQVIVLVLTIWKALRA